MRVWGRGGWKGKSCGGRGREGAGLWAQSDLGLQTGGWWSLTEGLPCVDVNDEPGNLVSTQDLVIHWAKENGEGRALGLQPPWEDTSSSSDQLVHPCSPVLTWPLTTSPSPSLHSDQRWEGYGCHSPVWCDLLTHRHDLPHLFPV